MADLITDLATKAGISPDMARMGVGAVLEMCKGKLSPDVYSKLSSAVPGADGMIADAQRQAKNNPDSGGMMGAISGAIGSFLGGGTGELAGKLSAIGFSPEQLGAFVPQVMNVLKDKVPPDALQGVGGTMPTPPQ